MTKNTSTGFNLYSKAFSSFVLTEEDFEQENNGYRVGLKQAIARCQELESQLSELRKENKAKDATINSLTIANGIYSSTKLINIVGVIMTVIGSTGVGVAFKAPLTDNVWKWVIAVLSLLFAVAGTVLPLIIREIASDATTGGNNNMKGK